MPGEAMVSEAQEQILKKAFLRNTPANEVQTIFITGTPTGGNFILSYEGAPTTTIAHNAAAGTFQSALEALSNIGAGNIEVTGTNPNLTATFKGALAATPVDLINLQTNALTGGSSPTVAIARTTAGIGCIRQYYYLGLSTLTRESLGDSVTLGSINELAVANGYNRIRVKTDATEFTLQAISGFWEFITKECSFTASGATWATVNSAFICDVPSGTSGKLLGLRTVVSFTLADSQTQGVKFKETLTDPI